MPRLFSCVGLKLEIWGKDASLPCFPLILSLNNKVRQLVVVVLYVYASVLVHIHVEAKCWCQGLP